MAQSATGKAVSPRLQKAKRIPAFATAKKLTTSAVRSSFADMVNRASYGGERVIIHRRNKPVAALVPLEDLLRIEEIEDAMDIKAARQALKDPRRIPWEQVKKESGI